jgi:hypothetical protein
MTARELFAREGEWVTCPSGHRIMRFTRDVYCGEVATAEMFDVPLKGHRFGKCTCGEFYCGTDYPENQRADGVLTRGGMHIEGYWRM